MKARGLLLLVVIFAMTSCAAPETHRDQGTAVGVGVGAATGALLGQAIGGNTASTLMGAVAGAAVGGVAGSMIGDYMDKQEREFQRVASRSQGDAFVERRQNTIFVTFKSDVMFDVDSARLKRGAYDEIDQIADILMKYPETVVRIGGHTDSTGTPRHNLDLSEQRAYSVLDELVRQGIHQSRIEARGYGDSRPIATNSSGSGRQMNRRVTMDIIPVESRG